MIGWLFFDRFGVDFGVENRTRFVHKGSKARIKNQMRFRMDFGRLLERFWVDLGPNLEKHGAKLAPKSQKLRPQDDVEKWGLKHERRITQNTQVMGGWVPINHKHPGLQGAVSGPVDTPHRALKARWRIYIYIYIYYIILYYIQLPFGLVPPLCLG